MAIIRGHHDFDDHFTRIPNDWLRDNRLSLEARGLMGQIMSHRPGWNMSLRSLAYANSVGRDRIKRIIDELIEAGYLERSEKQGKDDKGRMKSFDYTTKSPEWTQKWTQNPDTDNPSTDKPDTEDRSTKKTIPIEEQDLKKTIPKKAMTADDYQPSEELLAELATKFPLVGLDIELEKFRDHHMAKGSKFSLWDRAFRKWVSQASQWSRPARAATPERLTNNQKAALLAMKYREQAQIEKAQQAELEAPVNTEQVKEIENIADWMKGVDDV